MIITQSDKDGYSYEFDESSVKVTLPKGYRLRSESLDKKEWLVEKVPEGHDDDLRFQVIDLHPVSNLTFKGWSK